MLTDGSRQVASWLIFDVGREMKSLPTFLLCLLLGGCAHPTAVKEIEATHESLPPRLLALLESPAVEPKKGKELPEMPEGGLSDFAVEQFRTRIAEFEFPLPAGTVLQLFPYELIWSGRFDGDAFGEPNGYLGSAVSWYSLSPKYVLYLKQSHYSSPKHGMVTVDDEAAILTKEEAERILNVISSLLYGVALVAAAIFFVVRFGSAH